MEKKYFETVDCNVELPKEDGKYGVVYGDGIDSYYFHLHNIKSEKWTSDENGKHLEFPEYWLRELPAPDSPKVSDEDVERLVSSEKFQFGSGNERAKMIKDLYHTTAQSNDAEMAEKIKSIYIRFGNIEDKHKELLQLFKNRNK
mgnify:CR=1 FL=1